MSRLLLIGANGQLGSDLLKKFNERGSHVTVATRKDFDVCDANLTRNFIEEAAPDVIINTSAFHKVEACEEDAQLAFAVNTLAVRNLADVAARVGAVLVHFSTDYVFGGARREPYEEECQPDPINVYGASKAAGEWFVQSRSDRNLIIRTSGLYGQAGSSGKGGNFVQTMLRSGREKGKVAVVDDQHLSPTFTEDLAYAVADLIEKSASGIYHVTNSDSCSWFTFAKAIFEEAGMRVTVHPITSAASRSKVRRPAYSVLGNARLEREGLRVLRSWREALPEYLRLSGSVCPAPILAVE